MPLYEYQCKKCHSLTERIQKFSDPPLTVCPHCGGELEQLLSAPAVQFKGSGWYVTDYAKKPSGGPALRSGNGSASSSTSEGKAELPRAKRRAAPAKRRPAPAKTSPPTRNSRSALASPAAVGHHRACVMLRLIALVVVSQAAGSRMAVGRTLVRAIAPYFSYDS